MRTPGRIMTALLMLLPAALAGQSDWRSYGQDAGGTRYSSLTQITAANVASLKRAWTYETGEPANAFQTTPVVIDGLMYLSTPAQRIVALNAATGREVWKYDPGNKRPGTHRGVSYWPGSGGTKPRLFFATGDNRLLALDAKSGQPVTTFGQDGSIDLRAGVADRFPDALFYVSSPPAIYKKLVIVGPRTAESAPNGQGPAGDIRAFDAITGKLAWSFHTLPRPGERGLRDLGSEQLAGWSGPKRLGGHYGRPGP